MKILLTTMGTTGHDFSAYDSIYYADVEDGYKAIWAIERTTENVIHVCKDAYIAEYYQDALHWMELRNLIVKQLACAHRSVDYYIGWDEAMESIIKYSTAKTYRDGEDL